MRAGRVTVDAGLKAISTDAGLPDIVGGAPDSRYLFMGDEHGAVAVRSGPLPALGERVTLQPGHCDPTVNLHDAYHVHRRRRGRRDLAGNGARPWDLGPESMS